jgi:hypothetical protein
MLGARDAAVNSTDTTQPPGVCLVGEQTLNRQLIPNVMGNAEKQNQLDSIHPKGPYQV